MNINLNLKLKIFAIIAVSFLAVKLVAPQVFLANTPKVNPLFIAKLQNAPTYIVSLPGNIINSLKTSTANIAQKSSSTNNNVETNTGHTGPYVTTSPNSTSSTSSVAPTGSKQLPISEEDSTSAFDKLASVTPPPQAAFVQVASGVSTYTDSSTQKTILKINKGTKYTVERYQLANGEIKNVIVIK